MGRTAKGREGEEKETKKNGKRKGKMQWGGSGKNNDFWRRFPNPSFSINFRSLLGPADVQKLMTLTYKTRFFDRLKNEQSMSKMY